MNAKRSNVIESAQTILFLEMAAVLAAEQHGPQSSLLLYK